MTVTTTTSSTGTRNTSRPTFKQIALSALEIDPSYQRDPGEPQFKSMVRRIVNNYDPSLLHALDVATWNGRFFVYDGYARLTALKILHERGVVGPKAMCQVIEADPVEQARLFVEQTARRTVRWPDKHRARMVSGDPKAQAVEKVFADLGLRLGDHGDVRAVGAVYGTLELGGPELLHDVVEVASACWRDKQYGLSDRMIDGLALLFDEFGREEMPRDQARKAFMDVSPLAITREVAARTSLHGSNNRTQLAIELLRAFNKANKRKLRTIRLDPKARAKRAREHRAAAEEAISKAA